MKNESELCEYVALWQTKQEKNTSRFIFQRDKLERDKEVGRMYC